MNEFDYQGCILGISTALTPLMTVSKVSTKEFVHVLPLHASTPSNINI
jgi:hypothetical protein